ncbi:MAG: TetR/AcrR family transcriptional regulator [Candidatus Dormibacteraeota bacterium]|uniref:TetR/AcrR family transcriptional regulator n=1 Tax=Candidatus Dormiibacter inghamiae TaxID=3127013 RepID=A0A934KD94_9BACT|nr:TetR/AcrR family transcriptional regulator [Candidatus Dormibacteraeota bacterium]MBJ7606531.1 TetR/AcrR family transcriptional regulator [Candidatus Dormibacteraeota bacterium]
MARAQTSAATAERILDAAVDVFWELPTDKISLDEVARRAGVTVQTVIRRFGGRDALFTAAGARESERIRRQRDEAIPGDPASGVRALLDHYEVFGDRVLKMLAEEEHNPALRSVVAQGRTVHRDWCARVFAAALAPTRGLKRERRLAQFVAICDVYIWKLLRRDGALSRNQTEVALVELLNPLLEES